MEKKKIIFKFFGVLLICILIFLPGYSKYQELSWKNRLLKEKIEKLRLSNRRLENEIKRLRDDPAYLEKVARDKLKVTRKGEVIYKVTEGE